MALTQIRALLNGQWITLAYNEESRAYEGTLIPTATSFHQEGGYYNVEVEASSDGGSVYAVDGSRFPALKLVVREQVPPVLSLVSPPFGYLNTSTPAVTAKITDEEGGSGVDPGSIFVTLDGVTASPEELHIAETSDGYTVTYLPSAPIQDGPHEIVFSASDNDGNIGELSVSYHIDTENPVISIVSPPEGYVTNSRPVLTFLLSDEEGGSGVDISTVSVSVDGDDQTAGASVTGSTLTFTPLASLPDGFHSFIVSAQDNAGNGVSLTAAYTVDTVPPELWVDMSDNHVVVDDDTVTIRGVTSDTTASPVSVYVKGFQAEVKADGSFRITVPLDVAENHILVRAIDAAGLYTDKEVYRIRLVTDRDDEDLEKMRDMLSKTLSNWTADEKDWFETTLCRRGSYDSLDLNRVNVAADYLRDWLWEYGYAPDVSGKRGWITDDVPVKSQADRYIRNISEIRRQFRTNAPQAPPGMEWLTLQRANDIELILVLTDALRPLLDKSYILSGEAFAGEF